ELASLIEHASPEDRQLGFGLAVINLRLEAARLCLDAGADPQQFLPVHRHSTPLHQAAVNDDVPMLTLLVERGGRLDTLDTLWRSTPLGWAVHNKKSGAEDYLRSLREFDGAAFENIAPQDQSTAARVRPTERSDPSAPYMRGSPETG